MKAVRSLVINCSPHQYNLGACKLVNWLQAQGHEAQYEVGDPGPLLTTGYDKVYLSVIFSWDAPRARDIAVRVKHNSDVECGGPGMTLLAEWWRRETGLEAHVGLDQRFERFPGAYRMTFSSRGCDVGCSFCLVPLIEGKEYTLYWDFQPASMLADNNLSALPVEFQEHVIKRYQETGTRLVDANSGFEPMTFDEGTYHRWKPVIHGPWRFAFDEQRERAQVERTMDILKGEAARRKQVYVLVGNEPIESCYERAETVRGLGGEPWCQFFRPLNWLGDPDLIRPRYDWTYQLGVDFCRYYNRRLWRQIPITRYSNRKNEPPPFEAIFSGRAFAV